MKPLPQKLVAEALGSSMLLATIVGSGLMGERLSAGIEGLALLANALATGSILFVLVTVLEPISGAHLNPVVTAAMVMRCEIKWLDGVAYVAAQIFGAIVGVAAAHAMFDVPLFQLSEKMRSGFAQGLSEVIATFGLISVILLARQARSQALAQSVALYITSAYWFTASTSFANPAVTIARSFTNTFSGIRLADVPLFILAQLVGASLAVFLASYLVVSTRSRETTIRAPLKE